MSTSEIYKDYHTGGSPMPGRNFSSSNYRFGFNGQEKTDEISGEGNHNTAKFWEYDTRLCRRWNIDPIDKPFLSGYSTFNLNPIWYADPLGLDGEKRARNYQKEHGGELKDLGKGKFEVVRGFKDKDGVFNREVSKFKDNIFEKAGKSIAGALRKLDNAMDGDGDGANMGGTLGGVKGLYKTLDIVNETGSQTQNVAPLFGPFAPEVKTFGGGLQLISLGGKTLLDIDQKGVKQGLKNGGYRAVGFGAGKVLDFGASKLPKGSESLSHGFQIPLNKAIDMGVDAAIENSEKTNKE